VNGITHSLPEQQYDTDLCIIHYDVYAIPDFKNNKVDIKVEAEIKNFSQKTLDMDGITVGKSGNHDDWDIEMKKIFTPKTVQHPYYNMTLPLFEVSFKDVTVQGNSDR